jgi:hypothetical protein
VPFSVYLGPLGIAGSHLELNSAPLKAPRIILDPLGTPGFVGDHLSVFSDSISATRAPPGLAVSILVLVLSVFHAESLHHGSRSLGSLTPPLGLSVLDSQVALGLLNDSQTFTAF